MNIRHAILKWKQGYLFSNRLPGNQLRLHGDEQGDVGAFTQASHGVKTPLDNHAPFLAVAQENGGNVYFKCPINLWTTYDLVNTLVIFQPKFKGKCQLLAVRWIQQRLLRLAFEAHPILLGMSPWALSTSLPLPSSAEHVPATQVDVTVCHLGSNPGLHSKCPSLCIYRDNNSTHL